MKVDANSWLGRLAFGVNPYIADECSLYRALVWGLIKRGFFGVFLPTLVAVGIIATAILAFEIGGYPWFLSIENNENVVLFEFIHELYWTPIAVCINLSTIMCLIVLALVPVALVLGVVCLLVLVVWQYVIVKITKRVGQVTVAKVLVTGVSNKLNRLCRPIEVTSSVIPAGLVEGARILTGGKEGIVRDLQIQYGRNKVSFDLVSPSATDVMNGWGHDWSWKSFIAAEGDIIILDKE